MKKVFALTEHFQNLLYTCDFPRILKSENGGEDCNGLELFEKEKITPDVVPLLSASEMKQLGVSNSSDIMSLQMVICSCSLLR